MATPLEVYKALTGAGASTTQAIGIMANIINESEFNPEAVGDNGTSFGIVQEHGSQYSSLVTGNAAADLRAQVSLLAQQGGFTAASGATPSEAAGNFAANYEKCNGCQLGGGQYMSRVGNASTVAGWVSSGRWPKSGGSPSSGGTLVGGATGVGSGCLVGNPFSTSLPLLGNISAGPACIFSKTQARALVGGLLLAGSGLVFLVGSLILASYGLKGTAAGRAAAKSAETVAGAVPVAGAPVRAGVAGARKASGGARKAAGRRKAGRREVAGLQASGASDLRSARREPGTLRKTPGRGVKTGSIPGPGRNAPATRRPAAKAAPARRPAESSRQAAGSSRQRAQRYAGTGGKAASDKPPF